MMVRRLTALAVGGWLLASCAGGSTPGDSRATAPAEGAEAEAEAQAVQQACEEAFGAFMDELRELDSRLSVGINVDEYSDFLGDARVAYDQVDIDALDPRCLEEVGVPLEEAFNEHIEALNEWNDCIEDVGCDLDDIDPNLQDFWADAGDKLTQAEQGLEELGEPA